MTKKLQVFISSTYKDLIDERQAAVEAILSAGHIPAGMELFKAGNDSQLDVIKRWIDESDVYMLILGGRYGSIEPKSGKSYTHLEYEYAVEKGIPVFAVVMNKSALDEKIKVMLQDALETKHPAKLEEFKELATSKICKFFDDVKDIKLAIHETLRDFEKRYTLYGWVSGKEVPDVSGMNEQIIKLQQENMRLKEVNEKLSNKQKDKGDFNGLTFHELVKLLKVETITLPQEIFKNEQTLSLLECFVSYSSYFATGVSNSPHSTEQTDYFFYNIAPLYMKYGLMEKVKATVGKFDKIHTSKTGHIFLAMMHREYGLNPSSKETAATEE